MRPSLGWLLGLALVVGCASSKEAPPPEPLLAQEGGGGAAESSEVGDSEQLGPLPASLPEPEGFEFVYAGNQTYSDFRLGRVLAENAADLERQGLLPSLVDDAAFAVEEFYRQSGFPSVDVEFSIEKGVDPARVTFRIEEGPRVVVRRIELTGEFGAAAEQLASLIGGPRAGMLGTGELYYVEGRAKAGASAMAAYLLGKGFLDATVDGPEVRPSGDGKSVVLSYRVQEGPRYEVGRVQLGEVPEEARAAVEQAARRVEGVPFYPRLAYQLRAELLEILLDEGFADAQVDVVRALDREEHRVDLTVELQPGQPVLIEEVVFRGNETTRGGFLLSRMRLRPGDRYDRKRERESFYHLVETGLFRSVSIQLEESQEPQRKLFVDVVEEPSMQLWVEPGWGSYELLRMRFGLSERNIFGTGRQFHATSALSVRAQSVEVGLTDPWFLRTSLTADLSTYAQHREEPSYTIDEIGTGFSLSHYWTRHLDSTLAFRVSRADLSDVDANDPDLPEPEVDLSILSFASVWDTRSNPFVPQRGHRWRGMLEWSDETLGSDLDFLRAQLAMHHFFGISEDDVLALSLRAGAIAPFGDTTNLPIQERFFNGGENSVRSFREDELGPLDAEGDPIGGQAFTTVSAEWRRRVAGNFQTALFTDAGNVAPDYRDYFEFEDFRFGVGVGLRYLLPIGPVRLDFGWNPNPREQEDDFAIHLAVGMAF